MNEFQYILQPYSDKYSRHNCPACKKSSQFTRYINRETGEQLADHVGKCNRIDKCGYHYPPRQYFTDNNFCHSERSEESCFHSNSITFPVLKGGDFHPFKGESLPAVLQVPDERKGKPKTRTPQPETNHRNQTSYIDPKILKASLTYNHPNHPNHLITFLYSRFNKTKVDELTNLYQLGTSSRWNGGTTIFWQIDQEGKVRTGKLIKYDPQTGKRLKLTNWAHTVLKLENFNLKQCLFGEHLLTHFPDKVIGIVESEKTALIASIYLPDLLWLATGGAENLNRQITKPLKSRKVILFPDTSKGSIIYNKWLVKANKLGFETSDFLEKNTTFKQKEKGVDLADILLDTDSSQLTENDKTITIETEDDPSSPINQEPYDERSPVAQIDIKLKTDRNFSGKDLVIKQRCFTSVEGDKIELVGIRDKGYCGNYKTHKHHKGYCPDCMLNCTHTLKVNGKLQQREYTQLSVLLLS